MIIFSTWMLQLSSAWKWRSVNIIYSNTLLPLEVKGQWGLLAPHSLSPHFSGPHATMQFQFSISVVEAVLWGCAGPPSPTALVLCHGPVVSSQWIGWWFSHACFAKADFSVIPLSHASRLSFTLILLVSSGSPNCLTAVMGRQVEILTDLWPSMTYILSSAWLQIAVLVQTSSFSPWWQLEHSFETLASHFPK